jgi:hypothetical protein
VTDVGIAMKSPNDHILPLKMTISEHEFHQMSQRVARARGKMSEEGPDTAREGCADEKTLHQEILNECRRRGWIAIHARMNRPTTIACGVPDFLILADRGRLFLVEAKSKSGKLRSEQLAFIAWATKLSHTVHIVRSCPEFLALL